MADINIRLKDYLNSKDGSLLIKRNGKWEITDFNELSKELDERLKKAEMLSTDFNALKKNTKHFKVYSKSHFFVVFNSFMLKVIGGEIDAKEDVLTLDTKVLNDEITIQEAIEKHPYLKNLYTKLYIKNEKELIEFPEV